MPIYEYRCLECGEIFSLLFQRPTDANGEKLCSACGSGQTQRLMSSFAIGGRADPGPGRAAWPTTWNDTNGADPETLRYWRRRIEREARLEEKYPELRIPVPQTGHPAWGAGIPSLRTGKGEAITSPPERVPTTVEHSHDGHHHHHHDHNHVEPGG